MALLSSNLDFKGSLGNDATGSANLNIINREYVTLDASFSPQSVYQYETETLNVKISNTATVDIYGDFIVSYNSHYLDTDDSRITVEGTQIFGDIRVEPDNNQISVVSLQLPAASSKSASVVTIIISFTVLRAD